MWLLNGTEVQKKKDAGKYIDMNRVANTMKTFFMKIKPESVCLF